MFYFQGMERFDASKAAHTILAAPGWVRAGLTSQSLTVREEAALELARCLGGEDWREDHRQLALTLDDGREG